MYYTVRPFHYNKDYNLSPVRMRGIRTVRPFHYNKDYNERPQCPQKSETVRPFHYNKDYNLSKVLNVTR